MEIQNPKIPHKEIKQKYQQKQTSPVAKSNLRKQYIQSSLRHPAERHHR
jgi:hypothetical protein